MLYRWPPPPRITHHLAGYQVTRWHLYGSQAPDITPTFPSNNFSRPVLTSLNVLFYTQPCSCVWAVEHTFSSRRFPLKVCRLLQHGSGALLLEALRIDLVDSLCNINIEWCTGAKSLSSKQIISPPICLPATSKPIIIEYVLLHAYNSSLFRSNLSWSELFYSFTTSLSEGAQNAIVKLSYYPPGLSRVFAASFFALWTEAKFLVILCTCILSWGPVTWGWPKAAPLYAYSK